MKNTTFRTLALLFVLFMSFNDSFSQQINPKIQEVFGDKTQELVVNDHNRLDFLTDIIENRITLVEMPVHEKENYTRTKCVQHTKC